MADNVTLPGAGAVVGSDDVSGVQFQRVKLDAGGDGVSVPLVAGAQLASASLPVVAPTDDFDVITVTVTRPANTTTYAVNDAIADTTPTAGGFTIPNAVLATGRKGMITDVAISSDNDPALALQGEIFILSEAAGAAPADNAAFSLADTDLDALQGKIPFALEDIGSNQFFHAQGVNMGFVCTGSVNLRFVLRAKNAYVPASGEALTFTFKIQRL